MMKPYAEISTNKKVKQDRRQRILSDEGEGLF